MIAKQIHVIKTKRGKKTNRHWFWFCISLVEYVALVFLNESQGVVKAKPKQLRIT